MAHQTLPVEHLFTMEVQIADPLVIAGLAGGTRAVIPASGGSFKGARLKGTVLPVAGGDWAVVGDDGVINIDARLMLRTDDGANILMTYTGVAKAVDAGTLARTLVHFEAGDESHRWLNDVVAVAHGELVEGAVLYEVYSLPFG